MKSRLDLVKEFGPALARVGDAARLQANLQAIQAPEDKPDGREEELAIQVVKAAIEAGKLSDGASVSQAYAETCATVRETLSPPGKPMVARMVPGTDWKKQLGVWCVLVAMRSSRCTWRASNRTLAAISLFSAQSAFSRRRLASMATYSTVS